MVFVDVCLRRSAMLSPLLRLRLTGLLKRIGPAVGSTMPQFMTNWLGSYMSATAVESMLRTPGVVP